MSQQYPSRIRYEYEQDPETRLQYTHGVWGGINPQGEIEISFYLESDKMPPYSERIIAPDGSFGHEIAPYNDEEQDHHPAYPFACGHELPHRPGHAGMAGRQGRRP